MTSWIAGKPVLLSITFVLALSAAMLISGCGGGDSGGNGDSGDGGGDSGGGGSEPVAFDVSMSDSGDASSGTAVNFFEADEFTVSAGQEVTFNLTNDGVAIHNMRIAGPDGEYDTEDDSVSDPDLFTGGATGALVWSAPDEPGTIVFRCDFHPVDMVGTIAVE